MMYLWMNYICKRTTVLNELESQFLEMVMDFEIYTISSLTFELSPTHVVPSLSIL